MQTMEISEAQYRRIEPILPRQRGKVSVSNLTVLNAILYVAEQGCKWRGLPGEASDAKAGRELRGGIGPLPAPLHLMMGRAYEDNETRHLALDFGFIPGCRSRAIAWNHGNMTRPSTASAMRSSGSSGGSKGSAASSPASTNSMSSSLLSSVLPSSSRRLDRVNTP
jgi:hypothetical protein